MTPKKSIAKKAPSKKTIKNKKAITKPNKSKKVTKSKVAKIDKEIVEIDEVEAIISDAPKVKRGKKKNNVKEVEKKVVKVFSNPMENLSSHVNNAPTKKKKRSVKEPKGKFEIEYVIGTSPAILFEYISTPSGFSEWFSDDVNIRDGLFTFIWEGSEQVAKLLDYKEEKFIRFQWIDKPEGTYFEFRIEKDELTGDISLMVVDFAEEQSDLETSKLLWDSQIGDLMHAIGSY